MKKILFFAALVLIASRSSGQTHPTITIVNTSSTTVNFPVFFGHNPGSAPNSSTAVPTPSITVPAETPPAPPPTFIAPYTAFSWIPAATSGFTFDGAKYSIPPCTSTYSITSSFGYSQASCSITSSGVYMYWTSDSYGDVTITIYNP